MFYEEENTSLSLSELQEEVKSRVGFLQCWVRVEIESHRVSGGHHYLALIEKCKDGQVVAKASARIWRSNERVVTEFRNATGQDLQAGLSITANVSVDYHSVYGLTLIINEIDTSCALGERELERRRTLERLVKDGVFDSQKELELPFLPFDLAVISSETAAGYGDFCRHLSSNQYGFAFSHTLFPALMQGDAASASICQALESVRSSGQFSMVIILRGGGADSDLYCYDDYDLCSCIANLDIPVLTAVGHERDYHIADMVSYQNFKTPTAAAGFLIDWVAGVEEEMLRCADNIRFALAMGIGRMESEVDMLAASIAASNPLNILSQGYVLASDTKGRIIKSADAGRAGDKFSLRFRDGRWDCSIIDLSFAGAKHLYIRTVRPKASPVPEERDLGKG